MEQKEEINIQLEQNKETIIQKNEKRLRNLWDNFKHPKIQIIGVPVEEEEQEIKNLFEKIMKENFPSSKGNRHTSPGYSENPREVGSKKKHTKTHHN